MASMESRDEFTRKVLMGNVDISLPSQAQLVRIFTSSTFTDTSTERNLLMEKVYPHLKEYCQSVGYDFQVVDMRWGIRDEATDDHMTTELCLREIEGCQKLSTGPNFITFLGQKYGYRPFPPKIEAHEFESILKRITTESDIELVKTWFKKDENMFPATYILQPISSILRHHNNPRSSKEQQAEAGSAWWDTFEKLQLILRNAAQRSLAKKSSLMRYTMSVTEDEIVHGILQAADPDKHCLWFYRNISNIQDYLHEPKARFFIDKAGDKLDKSALALLEDLKNDRMSKALGSASIVKYNVKWHGSECIDPKLSQDHRTYLNKFGGDFLSRLTEMIDQGIQERKQNDFQDKLMKEICQHGSLCQKRCEVFHGRTELLDAIAAYVDGPSTTPFAVYGKSGCGKTSLLAMAVKNISTAFPDRGIILRFIGTSSESSSIGKLLYSVCCQIARINGAKTEEVPLDTEKLIEYLPTQLVGCTASVVLVLDSLDQLLPDDNAHALRWLPKTLPSHVKLILSTLPEAQYKVFPSLKPLLPSEMLLEVPVLPLSAASMILDAWLVGASRKLTKLQEELLLSTFEKCPLPLFLKLSFDEASRWKSYSDAKDVALQGSIADAITTLFVRLERLHGSKLVGRALGYLTASKAGLSDNEIDDLLSIDDDVLNDVYQYWTPPIRRIPPLLWIRVKSDLGEYVVSRGRDNILVNTWYHRQFFEMAKQRYGSPSNARVLHENLAEYYMGTWSDGRAKPFKSKDGTQDKKDRHVPTQPHVFTKKGSSEEVFNLRKLNELSYHLTHSKQLGLLKDQTLCNFDFLLCKLKAFDLQSVVEDFNDALLLHPEDEELRLVRETLQLSAAGLYSDPSQLPCQLIARLYNYTKFPFIKTLLNDARNSSAACLYPSIGCFEAPGGPLIHTLAGHTSAVQWISLSGDGNFALSVSQDNTARVWNVITGMQVRSFNAGQGYMMALWYQKDQCAILVGYSSLKAINIETEEVYFKDNTVSTSHGANAAIAYHGKRLVQAGHESLSVYDTSLKKIEHLQTIKHKPAENEDGFMDIVVAGGDTFVYSRGKTSEFYARLFSDPKYKKTVNTKHRFFHFALSNAGKTFVTLTSPSKMNEQYKQVFMTVYDAVTWTVLREFENQMNYMIINLQDSSLYVAEDGAELIVPTMFQIYFWNTKTGKERVALKSGYQGNQYKQARTANGRHLVVTSLDFNVHAFRVYDMKRLDYLVESDKGLSDIDKAKAYVGKGERELILHPKDSRLAFSIPPIDPILSLWDVPAGCRIKKLKFENMFPMAILPVDEKHIAVFECNQKKIFFIDYSTGTMVQAISVPELDAPNPYANTWEVIGNQQILLLAPNKCDINVFSLKTGRMMRTIKTGHKKMGNFVVCRDKSTMVSCEKSDDYEKDIPIQVTNIANGKRIATIKGDGMHFDLRPEVVSVSDNGKLLSYVGKLSNTIVLVDAQTGNSRFELAYTGLDKEEVTVGTIIASMMALNGGYVAAAATCQIQKGNTYETDYRLIVWSISTGRHLAWHLGGHFLKMIATEDGNRLLTVSTASIGNTRKAIELWDMKAIQSGYIQMLARFLPETDVRFCYLSLQGSVVCTGMSGIEDVIFFVPCGTELKQTDKNDKECPVTKVVYHHKPKK